MTLFYEDTCFIVSPRRGHRVSYSDPEHRRGPEPGRNLYTSYGVYSTYNFIFRML
jgi:hypothetical protein